MKTYVTPMLVPKGDAVELTRNVQGTMGDDLSATPPFDKEFPAGSIGFAL